MNAMVRNFRTKFMNSRRHDVSLFRSLLLVTDCIQGIINFFVTQLFLPSEGAASISTFSTFLVVELIKERKVNVVRAASAGDYQHSCLANMH